MDLNSSCSSFAGSRITSGSLFDAFIPGSSLVTEFLQSYTQGGGSSYITQLLPLVTVAAVAKYCYGPISEFFTEHFVSTAEIRLNDEMFNYLMYWITQQRFSRVTNRFVAGTRADSELVRDWSSDDEEDEEDWLSQAGKAKPLSYTPSEGTHIFRYKGSFVAFSRHAEVRQTVMWVSNAETLYMSCLGRNPAVLKELLEEAQKLSLERDGNRVIIYRASRGGSSIDWQRCAARQSRPMSTVILNPAIKREITDDVKEYLHPSTKRWYNNRGIPYRRGYLFYGPPGTGKTSLCFALAGMFRLKIYVISLNSRSLTEDALEELFSDLPHRCIVLLEDVDSAGITKNRSASVAPETTAPTNDPSGTVIATVSSGISLSGLLNTIDGVASSEGRILIMTTNHIELLDPALLRPGRVDMRIPFENADSATIAELFRSTYSRLDEDSSPLLNGSPAEPPEKWPGHDFPASRVASLAADFAAKIPPGEFSPAVIQGFLLKHKSSPELAVREATESVQAIREEVDWQRTLRLSRMRANQGRSDEEEKGETAKEANGSVKPKETESVNGTVSAK